ncbi:acyl-CoA dehydrogenase, partial [Nocardioides mangrovicus]|uniref:acyl-CoA dehydrogenase n=1 Tax=Nocardioides mangrovicus TaxID=2478913 RepID=UPI0022B78015
MLGSVARRLKRGIDNKFDPVVVFSRCQDHVIHLARAHVERLVLEAFTAKVDSLEDGGEKEALVLLRDLYALETIEADRAWFMEHGRLSSQRSKAVSHEVGRICRRVRPVAEAYVDAFGVPVELYDVPLLHPGD